VSAFQHHQKHRLEGVLGIVGVAQDATANAEHHGPMPRHQTLEGGRIAMVDEMGQELHIGQTRDNALAKQPLDLLESGAHCLDGHLSWSPSLSLYTINESGTRIIRPNYFP
jgi:hypothetical protein